MRFAPVFLAAAALGLLVSPPAAAATFELQIGDVLVGGAANQMDVHRAGVLVATLTVPSTTASSYLLKPAFSAAGDAYVPHWGSGQVHVFDRYGVHQGIFATVGANPESVDFDSQGNLFVGAGQGVDGIWKFDEFGTQTGFWSYSADYISLDDDCTLYFTDDSSGVSRLDVCTSGATPVLFVTPPGSSWNSDVVTSPHGLLIGTSADVRLYAEDGTLLATFAPGGSGQHYAVALDETGNGFYTFAIGGTQVYHVDIATAAVTPAFTHSQPSAHGLGVYGGARGPTAPVPELAVLVLSGLGLLAVAGGVLRRRA